MLGFDSSFVGMYVHTYVLKTLRPLVCVHGSLGVRDHGLRN